MNYKAILSILFIAAKSVTPVVAFFSLPRPTILIRCAPPDASRFSRAMNLRHGTIRPDASDAIAEALRISEECGPTSKEALVAWDIVEEMDSNDSR